MLIILYHILTTQSKTTQVPLLLQKVQKNDTGEPSPCVLLCPTLYLSSTAGFPQNFS